MKKVILGGAIAAVMASSVVAAETNVLSADYLTQDAYAGASVGFGDMGWDDAIILTGLYGKNLDSVYPNLGAEVEATVTLVDAEYSNYYGTYDSSYFGLSGYAVYNYKLGEVVGIDGLTAFGRVGMGFTSYEYEAYDDTDVSIALGLGVKYNLGALTGYDNLSARAEWTDSGLYDEFKAGVNYAF